MDAIRLDQVTKIYASGWRRRKIVAIQDVSLVIAYGESVGFIGHNGAGKSSSIRIALGLQSPTHGSVRLQGLDPRDPSSRRRVSYVPENPLLYDYLRPDELLRMAARMHGVPESLVEKRCGHWLERLGVAGLGRKRIRELSKGMAQRVALAQALVSEPEILILDEPLSGLDPLGRREVVDVLMDFRKSGKTLLFSSHILNDVEQLADRCAFNHRWTIRTPESTAAILGESSETFEVVLESANRFPGFEPDPGGQQRGTVKSEDLAGFLAQVAASGARIVLVRSNNRLENAYLKFVALAEAKGLAE